MFTYLLLENLNNPVEADILTGSDGLFVRLIICANVPMTMSGARH